MRALASSVPSPAPTTQQGELKLLGDLQKEMETVYCQVDGSTLGIDMNSHNTIVKECLSKTEAVTNGSPSDHIIIPDPTSERVNAGFYDILPRLVPILEEDNAQDFLHFFQENMHSMAWDLVTPETLLHIIIENSVRCAKVVLEGQAPELEGLRAYPNCVTQYGFFPIHQAAEIFSVDMIKLLIRHGALVNLHTIGGEVIKGLLPLHVAVENTCMHKYLDDNLFPDEFNPDYSKADIKDVYKLIHLLCLPEMKIFMDTTRLLAKHTNDLVGEICNYIKHGKLLQTAVLLLAAQEHIRGGCSCKKNSISKQDGFGDIIRFISEHSSAIKLKANGMEEAHLKENYISSILWIVQAMSRAGKALSQYIQRHSKFHEVPRMEILECVSSILKSYKFCPTGEVISTKNLDLSRYKCPLPSGVIPDEFGNVVASKDIFLHGAKAVGKKLPRLDLQYKRRSFFPFWRSALTYGFPVKVCPSYSYDDKHHRDLKPFMFKSESEDKGFSPAPSHNVDLLARMRQPTSNYQSKRQFGTAVYQPKRLFGSFALTFLKVLKKA